MARVVDTDLFADVTAFPDRLVGIHLKVTATTAYASKRELNNTQS